MISDDWIYRSKNLGHLRDFIEYALYYGNGRFLGNLFAMCFVQKPLLNALMKAATLTGVVMLLPKVCRTSFPIRYPLSFLLVAGVAPSLFGEVYTWTSGFMNYTPPILCMLFCLFLFGSFGEKEGRFESAAKTLLIAPAAFCGQLFVEHATAVNLVIAAGLLFFAVRKKDKRLRAALYLLGALFGAAAMVLIPRVFFDPYNQQLVYRSFTLGSPAELMKRIVSGVLLYSNFFTGSALVVCLLGALALYITVLYPEAFLKVKRLLLLRLALAAYPAYTLVNYLCTQNAWYVSDTTVRYLAAFLLLAVFLAALIFTLFHLPDLDVRRRTLTLVFLALFSICPLLLSTVMPERCILLPYMLLAMAALTLTENVWPRLPKNAGAVCRAGAGVGAAALALVLALTFYNIGDMNAALIEHVEKCVAEGKTEIDVFPIPSNYVFGYADTWTYAQVYHYEVRGDIHFVNIDLPRWEKRRLRERQAEEAAAAGDAAGQAESEAAAADD